MNNSWIKEQARVATANPLASPGKNEKPKKDTVRDDWEDDDDEEEDSSGERNIRIWEDANTRESRPMPSVIVSRGLSISSTSSSLPLNEPPKMRILKRPSPSNNNPTNINNTMGESLQDREARYLAARQRIFGTSMEDEKMGEMKLEHQFSKQPSPTPSISSQAIRELRGPTFGDSANGFNCKGFINRQPKATAQQSEDSSL